MTHAPGMSEPLADPYQPDSPYAWLRLWLTLLVATIAGVGMWAIVVVLPDVQTEFGIQRGDASIPYTVMMLGFAFGTIVLGRMADRTGIVPPILIAGACLGAGFVLAGLAPNLWLFSAAHAVLIGVGAGTGFAPLMADISHWFVKRRGFALVVVASGSYLAGTIWPLAIRFALPEFGWRMTYIAIGVIVAVTIIPLASFFRRQPFQQQQKRHRNIRMALGGGPRIGGIVGCHRLRQPWRGCLRCLRPPGSMRRACRQASRFWGPRKPTMRCCKSAMPTTRPAVTRACAAPCWLQSTVDERD